MLHELQTHFLTAIYDVKNEENAFSFIQKTTTKTPQDLLSIYRGSIFGGLKKALAETFPVTKELVGEDFFNMMLAQYIKSYPCQVQDLNDYGEELPKLIMNLKQARSLPYLSDVAQLEWFCNIALNVEIQKNNLVELSFLKEKEVNQIKFNLPNGSALLQVNFPVDDIWKMHQNDSDSDLELTEELVSLIVWKSEQGIELDKLSSEQFYFLNLINKGIVFADVCNAVVGEFLQADIDFLFASAVQHGWLRSYEI